MNVLCKGKYTTKRLQVPPAYHVISFFHWKMHTAYLQFPASFLQKEKQFHPLVEGGLLFHANSDHIEWIIQRHHM